MRLRPQEGKRPEEGHSQKRMNNTGQAKNYSKRSALTSALTSE